MKFKVVADSSCDLAIDSKIKDMVTKVPLTMMLEGEEFIDDETFDQAYFLKRVAESRECPTSACPSPQAYMDSFEGEEECVFVVTITSKLSGSYNSACIAKEMYEEEYGTQKKIHIFDSKSASIAEARLVEKIFEIAPTAESFEEVVDAIEKYRDELRTYFVLESLETLRKNGRLSNMKALVATVLSIKPILTADDGVIEKLEQVRGLERAIKRMIEIIVEKTKDAENKVLSISHCNCLERALMIKEELLKLVKFKDITIAETSGLCTTYAAQGGIIIAV